MFVIINNKKIRNMKSGILLLVFSLCTVVNIHSQISSANLWAESKMESYEDQPINFQFLPDKYRSIQIDIARVKSDMTSSPAFRSENKGHEFALPKPEGGVEIFEIFENNVIDESIKKHTTIRTFQGYSIDRPSVHIRCDISEIGFHAFVYAGSDSYVVEPVITHKSHELIVYYRKDLVAENNKCNHSKELIKYDDKDLKVDLRTLTSNLTTYKLSITSAFEYSSFAGGSPCSATSVLNAQASGLNMINPIYHRDIGINFTLVTPTGLIFCDANDPFDVSGSQTALIDENIVQTNAILGASNYDVGHLLVWENTGGVAYAGVVCTDTHKAGGFSGSNASITSLYVDYVAHEIGHQFSGQHNFVSAECQTSESNYRFEPGEGSSIMSYAGVCGAGYQNMSDPYFHSASIADIKNYVAASGGCGVTSSPGDGMSDPPNANAGIDITIPKDTPFILRGTSSSGTLSTWEQIDGISAAVTGPPDPASTDAPNFKYLAPAPATNIGIHQRFIPDFDYVLNNPNQSPAYEKLPSVARTMNFRLVTRNQDPDWGNINTDDMVVTVADTGPFKVTFPNASTDNWNKSGPYRIQWDVAGTDAHCPQVNVYLKFNGNYVPVITNAPNNGRWDNASGFGLDEGTDYRVAVACVTSVIAPNFGDRSTFYDVGDSAFSISDAEATTPLPLDFLSFDAEKKEGKGVDLTWRTTAEINTSHFEIQRSLDGKHFKNIGEVKTYNLASTMNSYNFFDKTIMSGHVYYRLKQVDLDGQFDFSDIVSVFTKEDINKLELDIAPNPASEYIEAKVAAADVIGMTLTGVDGKIYKSQNTSSNRMDLKSVPNGIYFLETSVGTQTNIKKVVVQK